MQQSPDPKLFLSNIIQCLVRSFTSGRLGRDMAYVILCDLTKILFGATHPTPNKEASTASLFEKSMCLAGKLMKGFSIPEQVQGSDEETFQLDKWDVRRLEELSRMLEDASGFTRKDLEPR